MQLVILMTAVGAAITGWLTLRGLWRWLVLRRLPVVDGTGFAAVDPGTAVILAGRTAEGPALTSPKGHRSCVHHLTIHVREHHLSGEGSDVQQRLGAACGDSRLHEEAGAAIDIDLDTRRQKLFITRRPLLINVRLHRPPFHERPGDEYYDLELITPPAQRAYATGRVGPDRDRLERYDLLTGSAIGDVADLSRHALLELTCLGGTALVLAGTYLMLTR